MAMQSGLGVSKILILAGTGYTATVLLNNHKLSDLLGELQSLVKGLEKSRDQSEGDSDYNDAIAAQVRRLAAEVRQLGSNRQITILNGNEGYGNLSSLVVPAAALGALGYGYLWWKGCSIWDFMYVTKKNMANAVSNLTKHLENLSDYVAQTKKHLTQRIQNVDDKMVEQNKLSREIKDDVAGLNESLNDITYDLSGLQSMVAGLNGKLSVMEGKQDIANVSLLYLCNFIEGKKVKMPENWQEQLKLSVNSRGSLPFSETPSLKGLKELKDITTISLSGVISEDGERLEGPPKNLLRSVSNRC
ncbi:hypothetical protein TorRG33x02_041410 [Trema orientale]|uniref:DUF1664 domain-containing protein n=1 Tax=Trema orientale TaxID=63057 RepID=A0A2P5FQK3_TREOI|nr:hypothetical protein TorRG33x02_041410 [Trema orientale]